MIFDTDILIWVQRGSKKAAGLVDATPERFISLLTYMELIQCPLSRSMQKLAKDFLSDFNFEILPITEKIGHRAAVYIEELSLATGMRAGDAIIAATAVEHNLVLASGNRKHFKNIKGLKLKHFKP